MFAALSLITLAAAVVNGGLGYGFSSITVPVALLFLTNRVLNPAMVLVEVGVNSYTLLINRKSIPQVWRRVTPMLLGVLPGVILGSCFMFSLKPAWVKLATYLLLLPFILLQAAGYRKPLKHERAIGFPFGSGIGFLYSVTTISGPPLALLFNNQGLVQQEFRAALGLIRITESVFTAISYYFLGLYRPESFRILGTILPSVLVGIPIGALLIRKMDPETFRRFCMSFDAWVVGYGVSKVLVELQLLNKAGANGVWLGIILLDAILLYRFFDRRAKYPKF